MRDLFLLREDVVFLNHGAFGACPLPVFESYQRWQREMERQPVEFLWRRFPDLMRTAREALGAYLSAPPDDLVYVPNATTGVNIVARSLPLQPGDEVLGTDHEYGACDRIWRFVCARTGARYVRAAVPVPLHRPEEIVDAIWSQVTPRTRVLFVSHISSPTALIFPIGALIRRARDAGILSVIDGAHAPGQVSVDLTALGPDIYAGNCHKWMCAPKGAGFLYVRRALQAKIQPLVVSWGWDSDRPSPSRFLDEQQWQGTRDVAAYLAVPAAIEFMGKHGWDEMRRRCHALAGQARSAIAALTGLAPLSPDGPEWYAQMVSLPLPGVDPEAHQRRLYETFRIEVPVQAWNGRPLIRVSIQAYNTANDVHRLTGALRVLLAETAPVPQHNS